MQIPTIVHVTGESGWRGGERQVELLVNGLVRRGVDQVVAAPDESPLLSRLRASGVHLLQLHPSTPLNPVNLLRLWATVRRLPTALLHSHSSHALSLAALTHRLANSLAVVHTRRVAFPARPSWKYRRAADHYVAISSAVGELMASAGTPRERVEVIRCCIDIEEIDAARAGDEFSSGGPIVGCVAALSKEKGLPVLLEAWNTVHRQLPTASLVLIGDGPEREAIETAADELGSDSVRLMGFQEKVPPLLKQLDLYVQPSLNEGLGTAVLEAMACRLPVIASRAGGLQEIVQDDRTGVLIQANNPAVLSRTILDLLADPERQKRLGNAGRAFVVQHHHVERLTDDYLSLYGSIAGGAG